MDEGRVTAIAGAEGLINSRPITYVSSGHGDLTPLTSNHFFRCQLEEQFAPEVQTAEIFKPTKRRCRVQQPISQFWKRWRREFLPSLNVRSRWFALKRELRENDIVLVVDQNAKRGNHRSNHH